MAQKETGAEGVTALAEADAPVFETLVQMTLDTFERSGLDDETYLLARIAALVAMDASAPSYLLNIGTAAEAACAAGEDPGTLVAIAPVVGSARVVSAARAIGEAFGLDISTEDQ